MSVCLSVCPGDRGGETRNFPNFLSRLLLRIMTEEDGFAFPTGKKVKRKMFILHSFSSAFYSGKTQEVLMDGITLKMMHIEA